MLIISSKPWALELCQRNKSFNNLNIYIMKKFVISTLVLLGISLLSTDLMASTSEKKTQNPWEEFKSVIEAYHHSNVDFYYTSQDEQKAFLEAAAKIKLHLEEKQCLTC
ncbi:MAG: hypothetical protein IPO04_03100 [Cytophagaceae bacterium]|nr:hypothetical protein [Cytophagaceae bacterium]